MSDNQESLPVRDIVFELSVRRLNAPVADDDGRPFFPRACVLVDAASGFVLAFEFLKPDEDPIQRILELLDKSAKTVKGYPRQIQVRDPRLARDLRDALDSNPIEVVVREALPMLDEAVQHFSQFGPLSERPKGADRCILNVPGMTLDHLIAFVEAAEEFHNAAPWQYLVDEDLIEIHSPAGPKGTRFTQVLGAGGQTFGLGFVGTRQANDDMQAGKGFPRGRVWSFLFKPLDGLSFEDGELWERHNLPALGEEGYPEFTSFTKTGGFDYPKPDELIWAEGLLRAIAATTEQEMDSGRWEKTVDTMNGEARYSFSLPILLEQLAEKPRVPTRSRVDSRLMMEEVMRAMQQKLGSAGGSISDVRKQLQGSRGTVPEFTPRNDAERATALCYRAREATGRRAIQLAREAIQLDPNCCEAYLIFAERVSDSAKAIPLFQKAVEAGERQLGDEALTRDAGHFWGLLETRPYMRARQMLAMNLIFVKRFDEAIEHLRDMLRLNPGDNQGNRYSLASALLAANRLDELDTFLNHPDYRNDGSPEWKFTRLLLTYRRQGDSPISRQRLAEAVDSNEFVVPIVTGRIPPRMSDTGFITAGGADEAAEYLARSADAWDATPGILEWLESAPLATQEKRAKQWQRERNRRKRK